LISEQLGKLDYIHSEEVINMKVANAGVLLIQLLILGFLVPSPVLSEKACVKNASGKVVCGDLIPNKKTSTTPSLVNRKTQTNLSGVDLILEGCIKSREGLLCSLTIYNSTDYDKDFRIYYNWVYKSSLIDGEGNEYAASQGAIGSKEGLGGVAGPVTLPPKLKMKSQLLFRPNGRLDDYIRILKIEFAVERKRYQTMFRDFQVN
jgi:hypothetical protein